MDRSLAARKGWARRRLNEHLKAMESWLQRRPSRVTVWAEDYELLATFPEDVEIVRGPPKPARADERMPIHR